MRATALVLVTGLLLWQVPSPPGTPRIGQPATNTRGPQASITCPAGAINVSPGQSIQAAVSAQQPGTTFCLRAGVHPILGSITPKSGQTFVGEFGAILDASAWVTNENPADTAIRDAAVFQGLDNNVTGVTIKNLYFRDGPEYAINSWRSASGWTVDHCEISGFRTGVAVGVGGTISNNWIHHNIGIDPNFPDVPNMRGGAFISDSATGTRILNNEINNNGPECKLAGGFPVATLNQNHLIAGNFVHHNYGNGLWIDGDGGGSVFEDNIIEDNGWGYTGIGDPPTRGGAGIDLEQTNNVIIRNNQIRRHTAGEGVYLTITKNATVTGNIIEDNLHAVGLYLNFASIAPNTPDPFPFVMDLANNVISGNTIRVTAITGLSPTLGIFTMDNKELGGVSPTPYETNAKNNIWSNNTYYAPSTTGNWFHWDGVNRTFTTWQALPQDAGSTLTAAQ